MAFHGKTFVFDGQPSENYQLSITSTEDESFSKLSDVELMTTKIYRRPTVYLYGVSQSPVLQFNVQFDALGEISADDLGLISQWLFGQQVYKKLQIMQEDMVDYYFNCFFTNPELIRRGNLISGVRATVVCDSPFAWTFPQTKSYTFAYPAGTPNNYAITFDNYSQDSYYLYPTITMKMNPLGGNIFIANLTDNTRLFGFTGLSANEEITIDNNRQIITSDTLLPRLSYFNEYFFRLLPGRNNLLVTGEIVSLSFTYQFAKKTGG